jgi:hypothetical protein
MDASPRFFYFTGQVDQGCLVCEAEVLTGIILKLLLN